MPACASHASHCPTTAALLPRRPTYPAPARPPASCPPAGKRQDNRAAPRPGSLHQKGWRFFADDEDEFGLEEVLQVRCPVLT